MYPENFGTLEYLEPLTYKGQVLMERDLLPEELVESLLQQAAMLTLQSHGYTSIHPLALNLLIETVQKRLAVFF